MNKLTLDAEERTILGKKVKRLRSEGKLPAHVFGKGIQTEHISVDGNTFLNLYKEAGETGLVDLNIKNKDTRPVLIRDVQYDPVTDKPLHIDFYQVNLKEKVSVQVPIILVGEEPEVVHTGEAVVLQTLNEVTVEALPTDLVENIEVDISALKNINDALTVGQLNYDREKLTINIDPEEIAVKLAPAVTEEMKKLLEEQEAEAQAAQAEVPVEGEKADEEAGEDSAEQKAEDTETPGSEEEKTGEPEVHKQTES